MPPRKQPPKWSASKRTAAAKKTRAPRSAYQRYTKLVDLLVGLELPSTDDPVPPRKEVELAAWLYFHDRPKFKVLPPLHQALAAAWCLQTMGQRGLMRSLEASHASATSFANAAENLESAQARVSDVENYIEHVDSTEHFDHAGDMLAAATAGDVRDACENNFTDDIPARGDGCA